MSTFLYNSVRLMLKPWRPKREIFHFVFSKAMTQSSATKMIFQLRKHIQEKPKVLMLSINSVIQFMEIQLKHKLQQKHFNKQLKIQMLHFIHLLIAMHWDQHIIQQVVVQLSDYIQKININLLFIKEYNKYYLMNFTEVYANPFSLIGEVQSCKRSIGFQNVLQNFKINYSKNKRESILIDAFTKVSEKQLEFINKELRAEFQFTLDQIKQNRAGKIQNFEESRIYTAQQALENGLIDEINTFDEILAKKYPKYKFRELTLFKDESAQIIVQGQLHLAIENLLTKFENNYELQLNENAYHDVQEQISELLSNALNNIDIVYE